MKKITYKIVVAIALAGLCACEKAVEIDPPKNELTTPTVFNSNITATAAMMGIYARMNEGSSLSFTSSSNNGMAADELVSYSTPLNNFYTNSLVPGNDVSWVLLYRYIYQCNMVIENVTNPAITEAVARQLTGEALFIRAFCHFYLVNYYGDVPYIKTTDYRVNNLVSRTPRAEVYQQLLDDLKLSQSLINKDYLDLEGNISSEKVRVNKAVVSAMLARVYLYLGDWANAEIQATAVINDPRYKLETDISKVFLMNSNEAILQFMPNLVYTNTYDANAYVLTTAPASTSQKLALSDYVWNAFEPGDKRKTTWIGTFTNTSGSWRYPYKYKSRVIGAVTTEYPMVLRLGEQYLIRAEARAQLDKITEAVSDINALRFRARTLPTDLPDIASGVTKAQCLAAIEHERFTELFTEWGHRWLDLKRTQRAIAVLAPVKGTNWQNTDTLYPIPQAQLDIDPNMAGHQNPGY